MENFSKLLSGFGVLLFISGLIFLFFNWKIGATLVISWFILVGVAILIEPRNNVDKNIDNLIGADKIKPKITIGLLISIIVLILLWLIL